MDIYNNKYAVVGMGCIFPDADNCARFWENISSGRVSIRELGPERLDSAVFHNAAAYGKAARNDKTYTRMGAVVDSFRFEGSAFHIPPAIARHMDDNQKVALLAVKQALAQVSLDALDKKRIAVYMGVSGYGELYQDFTARFEFTRFTHYLQQNDLFSGRLTPAQQADLLQTVRRSCLKNDFPVTEDSAPGMLPSIVASRIANVYDFHGPAFTVDAACASGLAAIVCGVHRLQNREADAVICGAVDMPISPAGFIYFSGIGALSPDGSFPFDERANGFVIGQGCGVVVLKRLADAVTAGDSLYAVITGFGSLNDGKGKAIAAPNSLWQGKTVEQACRMAGYPVDTVELIEAHGTATRVGDQSEVQALKESFHNLGATRRNFCGLTSVKSNIGHLKAAAGIAGFIKAVLAIHHKTLPAIAGFLSANKKLSLENSSFYLLNNNRAWEEKEYPRRAGVNAFGFGGVNYHIALEEYRAVDYRTTNTAADSQASPLLETREKAAVHVTGQAGSGDRECFIILVSGNTEDAYYARLQELKNRIMNGSLAESAEYAVSRAAARQQRRAAFFCSTKEECLNQLELLTVHNRETETRELLKNRGVHFCQAPALSTKQTAFLFPGQGSQYPDMLAGLPGRFSIVEDCFARGDHIWKKLNGMSISSLISPDQADKQKAAERLKETRHTHPALFLCSYALFKAITGMGVEPGYVMGHSAGELAALAAAGVFTFNEGLRLMDARGRAFDEQYGVQEGAMAAISCTPEETARLLEELSAELWIANYNSPLQNVVSGSSNSIDHLLTFCCRKGIKAVKLSVSRAFHSPLAAPAAESFRSCLEQFSFRTPRYKVMRCETAGYYPQDGQAIRTCLESQITAPVRFQAAVEQLYADGVRLFVETGPHSVLSCLVKDTLQDKDCTILTADNRHIPAVQSFSGLACGLFTAGFDLDLLPQKNGHAVSGIDSPGASAPEKPAAAGRFVPGHRPTNQVQVVYSGVAVGLPGSYKESFRDDNFEQLCDGRNFIEHLTDAEKQSQLDLHITRLIKTEQGASYVALETLGDVIQLAGKLGRLDLENNYRVDARDILSMSSAIAYAVAAGYEALRDAQIPLVQEYTRTTSGALLPGRWALPQAMQEETGIIFANGFPMIDPVIREVSRHIAARYGHSLRKDLCSFYESLLPKIPDSVSRKILTDWYALNYTRLHEFPGQEEVYRFNHLFMSQLASQANNRLAQYIGARGPNFSISATCSSTVTAISLSEALIKEGRVQRMIVIGADDTANPAVLPYIGAGFLSTGACTSEGDLYEAAVPFDKRRNGMIMGSGAVGIVVESAAACTERSTHPVAELLGTHCFNTAGHQNQLDVAQYVLGMERFITRMEQEHGLDRHKLAPQLLYMSHEPYTPARGGCSQAEAVSLRNVFGDSFRKILVSNTKGMTGHTMGASLEDAAAAQALQYGRIPPVVNHKIADPELEGLQLARGGAHHCIYALRMAAGFGGQGNYLLLRKAAEGDKRIADTQRYYAWLQQVSGIAQPVLEKLGRLLVIRDSRQDEAAVRKEQSAVSSQAADRIKAQVYSVISEISGYAPEILDDHMELEADLGIDTVKQATILANLGNRFGMSGPLQRMHISDYPTIGRIIEYFSTLYMNPVSAQPEAQTITKHDTIPEPVPFPGSVKHTVLTIVAEVTGYRSEILDESMELEADLGIDTVKQATILSKLAGHFGYSTEAGTLHMSDYPSIGHLIQLFGGFNRQSGTGKQQEPFTGNRRNLPAGKRFAEQGFLCTDQGTVPLSTVTATAIIAGHSDYVPEMLEADLVLGADLGFNAVQLALFRSAIEKELQIDCPWQIDPCWTVGELEKAVARLLTAGSTREQKPVSQDINLCRQVLTVQDSPAQGKKGDFSGKTLLILAEHGEIARQAAACWADAFGAIHTIIFTSQIEAAQAADCLAGEKFSVLIDLTAVDPDRPVSGSTVNFEDVRKAADSRFALLQPLEMSRPERILCVTAVDGTYGIKGDGELQDLYPVYGIYCGFYKALRKEWRETEISLLDLPPRLFAGDVRQALSLIYAELSEKGNGVEAGYYAGRRISLRAAESSFHSPAQPVPPPDAGDVYIVTGGASGITAELLRGLAGQYKTNFAVIGTTTLLPEACAWAALDGEQLQDLKKQLYAAWSAGGKCKKPAQVEAEWIKVKKNIAICNLINDIRNAGCGIRYYSADVRDREALKNVLDAVRSENLRITGIIHGAGREISRSFAGKSLEEFRSVYESKILGALNLESLCTGDPLKIVAAFSSIAGRFGSNAQVDYAAANEFLCLWARSLRGRGHLHAVSLIWSGWDKTGMAFNNTFVRENAEALGLNLIDPAEGVKAALLEMGLNHGVSDVLLHRGLGFMAEAGMMQTAYHRLPFIDWFDHDGKYLFRSHRIFSVNRDSFMDQHRLNGVPLIPGVCYMEMLAEHIYALTGQERMFVFRNLKFHDAFKLYRDEARVLTLQCLPGADKGEWSMQITAPLHTTVKKAPEVRIYAEGLVCSTAACDIPFTPANTPLVQAKSRTLREILHTAARFRQNVIFGPLFSEARRSGHSEADNRFTWNEEKGIMEFAFPQAEIDDPRYPLEKLLINPAFLDSLHQGGAIMSQLLTNEVYLPAGAGEFAVLEPCKTPGRYILHLQAKRRESDRLCYDMVLQNKAGDVCCYIRDSEFHRINQ